MFKSSKVEIKTLREPLLTSASRRRQWFFRCCQFDLLNTPQTDIIYINMYYHKTYL